MDDDCLLQTRTVTWYISINSFMFKMFICLTYDTASPLNNYSNVYDSEDQHCNAVHRLRALTQCKSNVSMFWPGALIYFWSDIMS